MRTAIVVPHRASRRIRLERRMLLIHGTMDDNVHMQNSVQFAYELQKAGKPFEMMVYPKSRHGSAIPADHPSPSD